MERAWMQNINVSFLGFIYDLHLFAWIVAIDEEYEYTSEEELKSDKRVCKGYILNTDELFKNNLIHDREYPNPINVSRNDFNDTNLNPGGLKINTTTGEDYTNCHFLKDNKSILWKTIARCMNHTLKVKDDQLQHQEQQIEQQTNEIQMLNHTIASLKAAQQVCVICVCFVCVSTLFTQQNCTNLLYYRISIPVIKFLYVRLTHSVGCYHIFRNKLNPKPRFGICKSDLK